MVNFVLVFVIATVVGFAAGYVRKSRKRGVKCIGCPDAGNCSGSCGGCSCGCGK